MKGRRVWISLDHPLTNFKKRYTQKTSRCGTVKWFIKLGLDPCQEILSGETWLGFLQIVWSLHSQTLPLTPKIGHKKKRKLDSKPTYDRVFFHVLTLKRLGGSPIALPLHTNGFLKNASSKERVKPWFFVSFNIIILNWPSRPSLPQK